MSAPQLYSGLSSDEAEQLLKKNGLNEIPEKKEPLWHKALKKLISPISVMLLVAALLSLALHKYFDFHFILILLGLNIVITLWQESKADNAIAKLNESLSQQIKTFRDDVWKKVDSRYLVVGDVIELSGGEIFPADGKVLEEKNVTVNEAALTGESLPKVKQPGEIVYSGAFVVTGLVTVEITATGAKTNFGKTIFSVENVRKRSLLEQDIVTISKFLTILSLIAVFILSVVFIVKGNSLLELITLDLGLIIAGVPISLPTVMTMIIEYGVIHLSKKKAIVRRLSALEDLANVNFVLTDKTGTLTKNLIQVQAVNSWGHYTPNDVLKFATFAAKEDGESAIDSAIIKQAEKRNIRLPEYQAVDYTPADSNRKRHTLTIRQGKHSYTISVGAVQTIVKLTKLSQKATSDFYDKVEALSDRGYRSVAVAVVKDSSKEKNMDLVGVIALSDTLRSDAKGVIEFLKKSHVGISMVTGDNRAIAQEIVDQLNLDDGSVMTKEELDKIDWTQVDADFFKHVGSFAEILPEDKLKLVQKAKEFYVVASNGDGVNDLPAIKAANVGIAVKNAVTALKSTADIVLVSDGIGVLKEAIIESRKIFARVYIYSLYRISESLRLIITIALLGMVYQEYPLNALQIIILALLNDIPIISLASDRVKTYNRPAKIDVKSRFILSSLFGMVGVLNSVIIFILMFNILHWDWSIIQTVYFLKLSVSGHLLIYVAHTSERWYKFLPSKGVIWATTITQLIATFLALTGWLMPAKLPIWLVIFVWIWAFFWMQVGEVTKALQKKLRR